MNRKIFSLVCIALYVILVVPIQCSQQNVYDARNKSACGTKEINRINEKNDIESKNETQLTNDIPKNDEDDKKSSSFNIFKRGKKSKRTKENLYSKLPSNLSLDEMVKIFMDNNKDIPTDRLEFKKYIINILKNDPEQSKFLKNLFGKLAKKPLKHALISPLFNAYVSNYSEVENEQNNSL
ncbi:fam-c protein [Plasmodium vinckei]|uniref:Fam-c protein n=1 Tax=Plasmodium vinckei TaxID=5860 RepID=A0A6V7TGW6_PLAVN|nr:fam-c protein [Plasmodium vinckei]